jgi:ribosomal protein S18 acetylase RimI-like enzyme
MKFKILQVDIRIPEVRTLLMYLQYKCLPYDTPMEIDRGHWWIAYTEEGKPVAFAGMIRSQQWSNAGYMCRAGVMLKYQGYGLQKRLIQARAKKARALNWEWLITDTTDNPASSNSLISMGFKLYQPKVPWANKNSLYWRFNVFEGKKRAPQRQKKAE